MDCREREAKKEKEAGLVESKEDGIIHLKMETRQRLLPFNSNLDILSDETTLICPLYWLNSSDWMYASDSRFLQCRNPLLALLSARLALLTWPPSWACWPTSWAFFWASPARDEAWFLRSSGDCPVRVRERESEEREWARQGKEKERESSLAILSYPTLLWSTLFDLQC